MFALVADGLPNRDIAARLGISDHTVKFHLASIFGKLGVVDPYRSGAARSAPWRHRHLIQTTSPEEVLSELMSTVTES